ncbi:MAG: universal stress protein [Sporichthyaceae bacterium]
MRDSHDSAATRTVVGVDGSAGADRALDWGLARAAVHGEDVVALRAWHGHLRHDADGQPRSQPTVADWRHEHELAVLRSHLQPGRDRHPDVRLVPDAVHGHPGHLLSVASQHAALLVIGVGHRGPVAEVLLGSVAQSVLHHSRCPVAVVR